MTCLKTRQQEWIALWLLLGLAVCVFETVPHLDLWVSQAFVSQGRFAGIGWRWVDLVYRGAPLVMGSVAVAALVVAIVGLRQVPRCWRRRCIALTLVGVLGVGLLVHSALKDGWGRPRPVATQAFGGVHPFQPALHMSDLCPRNCSFVSGHAAGTFVLLSVGALGSRRTRWRWWRIGVGAGALVGLARVAAGGHYASDIVFGLLAVWAVSLVLRELWLRLLLGQRALGRRAGAPVHEIDMQMPQRGHL